MGGLSTDYFNAANSFLILKADGSDPDEVKASDDQDEPDPEPTTSSL